MADYGISTQTDPKLPCYHHPGPNSPKDVAENHNMWLKYCRQRTDYMLGFGFRERQSLCNKQSIAPPSSPSRHVERCYVDQACNDTFLSSIDSPDLHVWVSADELRAIADTTMGERPLRAADDGKRKQLFMQQFFCGWVVELPTVMTTKSRGGFTPAMRCSLPLSAQLHPYLSRTSLPRKHCGCIQPRNKERATLRSYVRLALRMQAVSCVAGPKVKVVVLDGFGTPAEVGIYEGNPKHSLKVRSKSASSSNLALQPR
jgi:hypothetical protein